MTTSEYRKVLENHRHKAIVLEKAERDAATRSGLALAERQHYQTARYWQGVVDAMNYALDFLGDAG